MRKSPIRDLHSSKPNKPRFCDVLVENGQIYLEKKSDKGQLINEEIRQRQKCVRWRIFSYEMAKNG